MSIDFSHPALIKPDLDNIIYRYLDLEKFESLLRDNALFFCRSDTCWRTRVHNQLKTSTLSSHLFYQTHICHSHK